MVNQKAALGSKAPLDPSALALVLQPFGESRMLPREAYVDDDVFQWEKRHFFGGGWICVGRSDSMPAAGDQRAESVGQAGVFLMRDAEGTLRAFANACRHRNHELLACGETVNRPIVLCPYHAWSYRLDGSLRKAPGYDDTGFGNFDVADNGLVQLPAVEWHGWIFVDASGEAGPFEDHVAGLEEIVSPYEPARLVVGGTHEYEVEANWKILNENYQECYHCPVIHPELCAVSPPTSGDNYVHPAAGSWVGGWMDLREGADTMSLDGRTMATPLRGLDEERRHIVDYIAVFPNLLISLHPDYVMTHILTPLAANRTRIVCSWAFSPEDMARPDFDPSFGIDFWDITNRQDWGACASVQRGLSSEHAIPGLMSEAEDGVYQFVTMVARGYSGQPLRAGDLTVTGARRANN
jgi:Rieske 2Fe-2S family protein